MRGAVNLHIFGEGLNTKAQGTHQGSQRKTNFTKYRLSTFPCKNTKITSRKKDAYAATISHFP